jgi:hypothetical protein
MPMPRCDRLLQEKVFVFFAPLREIPTTKVMIL